MNTVKLTSTNRTLAWREEGRGPVLVLVHAFPLDSGMWAPQLTALSASHRVLAPDLPGFGGSDPVPGWSIDSAADLVTEWLQAIQVEGPIALAGLSMGGYIALAFARRHAALLGKLILADTKAEPDDANAREGRAATLKLVQESGSRGVMKAMLPKVLGATTHATRQEVVEQVREIGEWQSVVGVAAAVEALRDRPDARPGLASIAVPTLVIVGTEDTITPVVNAETLANGIRAAKLVALPTAGHLVNLETPEAFNTALQAFLS